MVMLPSEMVLGFMRPARPTLSLSLSLSVALFLFVSLLSSSLPRSSRCFHIAPPSVTCSRSTAEIELIDETVSLL